MKSNFKISLHKNSDSLHLKLTGDFDGTSALKLINCLKSNARGVSKIFIHTNCLKKIYPFGQHTFQKNLCDLDGKSVSYVFTGEKADQLAPQ